MYTYGVALNSLGQTSEAVAILESGHIKFPNDTDILIALLTIERDLGNFARALEYTTILIQLQPNDPNLQILKKQLESADND